MSVVRLCAGVEPPLSSSPATSKVKSQFVELEPDPVDEGDTLDDIVVHSRSSLDVEAAKAPLAGGAVAQTTAPLSVDEKIGEWFSMVAIPKLMRSRGAGSRCFRTGGSGVGGAKEVH